MNETERERDRDMCLRLIRGGQEEPASISKPQWQIISITMTTHWVGERWRQPVVAPLHFQEREREKEREGEGERQREVEIAHHSICRQWNFYELVNKKHSTATSWQRPKKKTITTTTSSTALRSVFHVKQNPCVPIVCPGYGLSFALGHRLGLGSGLGLAAQIRKNLSACSIKQKCVSAGVITVRLSPHSASSACLFARDLWKRSINLMELAKQLLPKKKLQFLHFANWQSNPLQSALNLDKYIYSFYRTRAMRMANVIGSLISGSSSPKLSVIHVNYRELEQTTRHSSVCVCAPQSAVSRSGSPSFRRRRWGDSASIVIAIDRQQVATAGGKRTTKTMTTCDVREANKQPTNEATTTNKQLWQQQQQQQLEQQRQLFIAFSLAGTFHII